MTDIFDEVEEEVRKERWEQLWKKYGNYAVAGAVAVVLAVGGYRGWQWYQHRQNEQASDAFLAAQQQAANGNLVQAESAFGKLAAEAPSGYAELARFMEAAVLLTENKREAALVLLRQIAEGNEPVLSKMARLRIGWAEADTASKDVIQKTLAPLLTNDSPFRFAASEILAYATLRAGERDAAIAIYAKLGADNAAPAGVKQRAAAIAEYLKANPDITMLPTLAAPPTLAPVAPAPGTAPGASPSATTTPPAASAPPAPAAASPAAPAPAQEPHPQ